LIKEANSIPQNQSKPVDKKPTDKIQQPPVRDVSEYERQKTNVFHVDKINFPEFFVFSIPLLFRVQTLDGALQFNMAD
jgi:hypothetical protein